MGDVTKNFSMWEFACPCTDCENLIAISFIERLQVARDISGVSYDLNSGYRCPVHNATLPDAVPDSAHVKGFACDIRVTGSRQRFLILKGLIKAGFTRIGISNNFIHVDCDTSKPPEVIWTYK